MKKLTIPSNAKKVTETYYLGLIMIELLNSFTLKELMKWKWAQLWAEVDIMNAYGEEWNEQKEALKPIYQMAHDLIQIAS